MTSTQCHIPNLHFAAVVQTFGGVCDAADEGTNVKNAIKALRMFLLANGKCRGTIA
jgi:hypothetical protein